MNISQLRVQIVLVFSAAALLAVSVALNPLPDPDAVMGEGSIDMGSDTLDLGVRPVPPVAQFEAITTRALFNHERTFTAPLRNISSLADTWRLTGHFTVGGSLTVMLRSVNGKDSMRLRAGETLDGWLLSGLDEAGAEFTQADKRQYVPRR